MIKNYNNDDLARFGIDSKYYVLYLIWKELTDRRTMDSYQYRIMNSLSILHELIEAIDNRINRFSSTNRNILDCKEEAASIIATDTVIKKHYPILIGILLNHLHQKADTDIELRALRHQIVYCYNTISPDYINYLVEDLEIDINQRNNAGITTKANMLVSNCAWNGWSTQALSMLADMLKGTVSNPQRWDDFKKKVTSTLEENYIVFIPINLQYKSAGTDRASLIERTHKEIETLGISVSDKSRISKDYQIIGDSLSANRSYMVVKVTAFDRYSACYCAIDQCANALNVLSFYNYIEAWNVKNIICFVHSVANNSIFTIRESQLFFTYDYLDSSQKIYKASKRLFELNESSVGKKLKAAYAYTNIGKDSASEEEQFMNLWIALESFCRSDVYENIISNVLDTVPPALCNRYIYRHFRNFIEDCLRCGIDFNFSTKSIIVSNRDRQIIVKELLSTMRDPSLYGELLQKCQVNSLLSIRCEELHKLLINDNAMFDKIKKHYTTVRRQLSRLYRIRNGIAHSAKTSNGSLRLYIEHLTDYLLCFVAEIVMYSSEKQENSAEIVFEILKDNYKAFAESTTAKNGNASLLLRDLLDTGIISLI